MNQWEILGIEKTKDKESIQKAYRSKLVEVNPEDNAEGFMRLRTAYEEALQQADMEETEITEEKPELLCNLEALYYDFNRRISLKEWENLCRQDEFMDLDTAESSMYMLLDFLTGHYYLPHAVFQFIVKNLDILKRREELRERYPGSFINYILNMAKSNKDSMNYELFKAADEDMDAFIRTCIQLENANWERDVEKERKLIEEIQGFHSYHPCVEMCKLWHALHVMQAQKEKNKEENEEYISAIKGLQKKAEEILNQYPEETNFMLDCGDFAMAGKVYADAEKYFKMAEHTEPDSIEIKERIAELYNATGRYGEAMDIFLDVLSNISSNNKAYVLGQMQQANENRIAELEKEVLQKPENEDLKRQLVRCYSHKGSYEQALELLESLSPKEEDAWEYSIIYAGMSDYEKTVESLFACKKVFGDSFANITKKNLHYLLAKCYMKMSNYQEARKYLELALEDTNINTRKVKENFCLLEYQCKNYKTCISCCEDLLLEDDNYTAYLYMAKSFYRLEEDGRSLDTCERAISIYPYGDEPYELELAIYWDYNQIDDMKNVLERFDVFEMQSHRVDMYRARMLAMEEDFEDSNKFLHDILGKGNAEGKSDLWDTFDVCVLLGSNYSDLGEDEQTLHYYLEALKFDTANQPLMLRIAGVYHILGEFTKAVSYCEKVLAISDVPRRRKLAYIDMAAALSCIKEYDRAKEIYELCEAEFGLEDDYVLDHGELLVRMNDLEGCVAFMEKCIKELGESDFVQYCIGNLCCFYGNEGFIEKAYETFQRGIANQPDDYLMYRSMGDIYLDHGMYEKARKMLEEGFQIDTGNKGYLCGSLLSAIRKLDDITKPEYAKYKEVGLKQAAKAHNTYTYCRKAEVYLGLKQYDEALAAIDEAIHQKRERHSTYIEDHHAWYIKGEIYEDMGEYKQALECYKKALWIVGHDALYEEKIKELS